MDESGIGGRSGYGSERIRAEMLHQLPIVVPLFLGPEHVVSGINPAAVEFFGNFNPLGMSIADVFSGADDQGIIALYDRAFAGETIRAERMRFAVITPGGHEAENFLDFTLVPFRDRDGTIIGTMGAALDVTDQVLKERTEAEATQELSRRYQRATDVIEDVQRALLPSRLPVLPVLDVAASYVVGGAEQAAGGDWFDVVPRGPHSVVLIVGDVVGHGVAASAVMAQLRAVTLERLHAGALIGEVIDALDRFVGVVPGGRGATVCLLDLDPETGQFQWCSAGHPPPLVIDPGVDDSYFLAPSGQPPLGVDVSRACARGALDQDQMVLLYSDGIIERPGVTPTAATVELRRVAASAVADRLMPTFSTDRSVVRATTQTLERLTRETGSVDDITLLAAQRVASVAPLHLTTDVTSDSASQARHALRAWLEPSRLAPHALADLDQIVTELVENVIEHAYGGSSGPMSMRLALDEHGIIALEISDAGQWRHPHPQPQLKRGLGLATVQLLSDQVDIVRDPGTSVVVTYRPWTEPHTTVPIAPQSTEQLLDIFVDRQTDLSIMTVIGPLDAGAVAQLDAELALCTAPDSPHLVIDLNDATVLSSSAIHRIRQALDRARTTGLTTTVLARPGTSAYQVLSLAAIEITPEADPE